MAAQSRFLSLSDTKCSGYPTGPSFDSSLTRIPDANNQALSGSTNTVTVEGVIVNDLRNTGYNGIYIQAPKSHHPSPPSEGDRSQAIFVYCGSGGCNVEDMVEGDYVRVEGRLSVFSTNPQLTNPSFEIISPAQDSQGPCPNLAFDVHVVHLALPQPASDDYRSFTGMLIHYTHQLVVTDLFGLRYGQISLAKERLINPTMRVPPGTDEYETALDLNRRGFIVLDDVAGGTCPVPQLYFDPSVSLRAGWGVEIDANVVMTWFEPTEQFFLVPNEYGRSTIPSTFNKSLNPRESELPQLTSANGVKLAGLNMLNYFTTLGCSNCRGADNEEEFLRQSTKLYATIKALDADVLGLQEVQNFDGEVLETLVEDLNNFLSESDKYDYIAAGQLGSDAIKNAIIYQPSRVKPIGDSSSLTYVDPPNKSRPSLAQTFEYLETGDKFTFVSNHLKSKGSGCEEDENGGTSDKLEGEGNCGFARFKHAQQLLNWLKTDPTNSNTENIVLVGDFNTYKEERAIQVLINNGFINLAERDVEENKLYSTSFNGEFGTLDYIFVNEKFSNTCAGTQEWHVNSDEPVLIDYNDEQYSFPSNCETKPEEYFDLSVFRASDHDPVITTCLIGSTGNNGGSSDGINEKVDFFSVMILILGIIVFLSPFVIYFNIRRKNKKLVEESKMSKETL